jgi:hypothetical protein
MKIHFASVGGLHPQPEINSSIGNLADSAPAPKGVDTQKPAVTGRSGPSGPDRGFGVYFTMSAPACFTVSLPQQVVFLDAAIALL